jgi:hypothetical protein
MKPFIIIMLVAFVGLFSGVGIASFGNTPPVASGPLLLLGSGLVGFALWGRKKFRR